MVNKSFWQDRPVLVTGGSGLLGGYLLSILIELKADITCIIRDFVPQSMFYQELVKTGKIKVVTGDIRDAGTLLRSVQEYDIDTIFHLAAQSIVTIANRNPAQTIETNVMGTVNILEASRASKKVKKVVIASSDKAYGDSLDLPYKESHPLQGMHPYEVSKSCTDLISKAWSETYQLPVYITRCGNLYGGYDFNWNRIIPGTIRSIIRKKTPIIRSDGNYTRDYFYVVDAAWTYLWFAEQEKLPPGTAMNFGSGEPISVIDLVSKISEIMEYKDPPIILGETSNEIREQYLDLSLANSWKWRSMISLKDGLEDTINWYRRYFEHA